MLYVEGWGGDFLIVYYMRQSVGMLGQFNLKKKECFFSPDKLNKTN